MLLMGEVRWCLLALLILLAFVACDPSKAHGQVSTPRRLRFKVHSSSALLVSWREPKGDVDSYLFLYNSLPDGQQKEIAVHKSDTKVLIKDYSPSKDYIISVIAVRGQEQSRPLQGRFKAKTGAIGGGDRDDESEPQRLTDPVGPPDDANEISGGGDICSARQPSTMANQGRKHCTQSSQA